MQYDVAVIGLGGVGSAALANLARRGARAIGIEQFARSHELGASSGRSRLIRKAYFENPGYVPLLQRAFAAWREVEALTNIRLLQETGLLLVGPSDSPMIQGACESAKAYDLAIEDMGDREISAAFPMTKPLRGEIGVFEREAGFLVPEASIRAHLAIAQNNGAQTIFETRAREWTCEGTRNVLKVPLEDGTSVEASRIVICAGPWWSSSDEPFMPVVLQRNVQTWFKPASTQFVVGTCPAFIIERTAFPQLLYGFPDYGFGVKAAFHGLGETLKSADELDRTVRASDVEPVRAALNAWMPGAASEWIDGKACTYALSPDQQFIVGPHPRDSRVIIAGGFSGHGFKFVPVLGEILADLALKGGTSYNLDFLSPKRFLR